MTTKSAYNGQKVRIQNRYATAEYDSMEEAARALSSIGVLSEKEVRKMLEERERYINGYAVEYPE